MLKPLAQFICDRCHGVIEKPEDGWFEWLHDDDHKAHSFRIVHHKTRCQYPRETRHLMDLHLTHFLGPDFLVGLYRFLDLGPYHDPDGKHVVAVRDVREFTEILRRLTMPYYEEARLYWNAAKSDGYFDGVNEVRIYMPDNLRGLIERYGDR